MIRFIKRHRTIVTTCLSYGPGCNYGFLFAVYYGHGRLVIQIYKHPRSRFLDRHGLDAVGIHLDIAHFLTALSIDHADVQEVFLLIFSTITDIVEVLVTIIDTRV